MGETHVGSHFQYIQKNQYLFEIVRDLTTVLERLQDGETVEIFVEHQKDSPMLDWSSSRGSPCGWSETATAMRSAYYAKNRFHKPTLNSDGTVNLNDGE